MKAEELLKNPSSFKKIKGFVWMIIDPLAILNYQGKLLKMEKSNGTYKIEFSVKNISGRSLDYCPHLKGNKLILFFGERADIQFYTNDKEAQAFMFECRKTMQSLFQKETTKKMKAVRLKLK